MGILNDTFEGQKIILEDEYLNQLELEALGEEPQSEKERIFHGPDGENNLKIYKEWVANGSRPQAIPNFLVLVRPMKPVDGQIYFVKYRYTPDVKDINSKSTSPDIKVNK